MEDKKTRKKEKLVEKEIEKVIGIRSDILKDISNSAKRIQSLMPGKEILETHFRSLKALKDSIPKINLKAMIPKVDNPEILFNLIGSPRVIQEKNAWERHNELLSIEKGILETQEGILAEQKKMVDEQRSTSRMTLFILLLTISSLIISIWSYLKSLLT